MSTVAKQWLDNTRAVMDRIEQTQIPNIRKAAEAMADTIQAERWVHTFGCGHATLPIEDMYPRIGGFVGFHPMCELPLTFFTRIVGEGGVHQFVFLERVEGYGIQIMKGYNFDKRDIMWLFSHSGINNVNIDVALEAKRLRLKNIAFRLGARGQGHANTPPPPKPKGARKKIPRSGPARGAKAKKTPPLLRQDHVRHCRSVSDDFH